MLMLIFLLAGNLSLFSQEVMRIQKKDRTVITIPVSDIELISFTGSGQSYSGNTIKDVDVNVYETVTIGYQVWMAENLRTTKYNDGSPIAYISDFDAWGSASGGAYCWYMNNRDLKSVYGALYNWATVETDKLCPEGWHVPVEAEIGALISYLKNVPGAKLKEVGNKHWIKNTTNVTNETKFTALPGGHRYENGKFSSEGSMGSWWTYTPNGPNHAFSYALHDYTSLFTRVSSKRKAGRSVRCIRD